MAYESDNNSKNLEAINKLKSGEKVFLSKIDGKQRVYTTFSDGSFVAFERNDDRYSIINIKENGDEESISNELPIDNEKQLFIGNNLANFKRNNEKYKEFIDGVIENKTPKYKELIDGIDYKVKYNSFKSDFEENKLRYLSLIEKNKDINVKKGVDDFVLKSKKDVEEYCKYLDRKNPNDFSISINIPKKGKIFFDYKHNNFDVSGKCLNTELLIRYNPNEFNLSEIEINVILEKFKECIFNEFLIPKIRDTSGNQSLQRATRLLNSVASRYLKDKELNNFIFQNIKDIDQNTQKYAEHEEMDSTGIRQVILNEIMVLTPFVTKFNTEKENFIKDLLYNYDTIYTEKVFDVIKNGKCNFIEYISDQRNLINFNPEQIGKIFAVLSKISMYDVKLKDICEKISILIDDYDESNIKVFSKSFSENICCLFDRIDKTNMRSDYYSSATLNVIKNLKNKYNKNIIVNSVHNSMPKFKDSNGKDSKIVFVKSMLETQLAQDQFINENTIINSDGTLDLIVNDKITIKNYEINSETKVIKEGQIFVKGIKLFSLENGKVKDIDIHKDKEIFLKKIRKI